jgi:hypothetical protein
MTEKDLLDLKKEIEEAKKKQANLQGRREALLEQLQKEYGVETIDQAQKKLKQLDGQLKKKKEAIADATEELEAMLDGEDTDTEEQD